MKKLKDLTKEEKFRTKGLNDFIENADSIAAEEFEKLRTEAVGPLSNAQIKDYGYMFRAGFLASLKLITIKINES